MGYKFSIIGGVTQKLETVGIKTNDDLLERRARANESTRQRYSSR